MGKVIVKGFSDMTGRKGSDTERRSGYWMTANRQLTMILHTTTNHVAYYTPSVTHQQCPAPPAVIHLAPSLLTYSAIHTLHHALYSLPSSLALPHLFCSSASLALTTPSPLLAPHLLTKPRIPQHS